jgi:nucleotide-binding universal stress UspA family protein
MTQRILCPVDLSECSHAALDHALRLAKATGAKLDVLHAYYMPEYIQPSLLVWMATGPRPVWQVADEQARTELDQFLARHGADISQRIDLHVVQKDPSSAILDFATEHRSSLIVMGTHGRTGASRLFGGSVAERVVRRAPCPVLTIREASAEAVAAQAQQSGVALPA